MPPIAEAVKLMLSPIKENLGIPTKLIASGAGCAAEEVKNWLGMADSTVSRSVIATAARLTCNPWKRLHLDRIGDGGSVFHKPVSLSARLAFNNLRFFFLHAIKPMRPANVAAPIPVPA